MEEWQRHKDMSNMMSHQYLKDSDVGFKAGSSMMFEDLHTYLFLNVKRLDFNDQKYYSLKKRQSNNGVQRFSAWNE